MVEVPFFLIHPEPLEAETLFHAEQFVLQSFAPVVLRLSIGVESMGYEGRRSAFGQVFLRSQLTLDSDVPSVLLVLHEGFVALHHQFRE